MKLRGFRVLSELLHEKHTKKNAQQQIQPKVRLNS